MSLTAKQEAFCQAIADGKSQADAYRVAYAADGMKPETIHKRASELMNDGEVTGRVTLLKQSLSDKSEWTRLDSVTTLRSIAESAEAKDSDKTGAVKVLNEMHGYNAPVKVEHSGSLVTTVKLVALSGNG